MQSIIQVATECTILSCGRRHCHRVGGRSYRDLSVAILAEAIRIRSWLGTRFAYHLCCSSILTMPLDGNDLVSALDIDGKDVYGARSRSAIEVPRGNDSSSVRWQHIPSSHVPLCWLRIYLGLMTIQKLRGFWGVLGQYLKQVKALGIAAAQ